VIYLNKFKKDTTALRKLLVDETKLPVHYDVDGYHYRGNNFFNIKPLNTALLEVLSSASLREYACNMRFYFRRAGLKKHTHMDQLFEMAERVQRLFLNNPQPEDTEIEFNNFYTRFNHSPEYWNLIGPYQMHNLKINNVDYEPSRDDSEAVPNLHIVEFDLTFNVLEIQTTRS